MSLRLQELDTGDRETLTVLLQLLCVFRIGAMTLLPAGTEHKRLGTLEPRDKPRTGTHGWWSESFLNLWVWVEVLGSRTMVHKMGGLE